MNGIWTNQGLNKLKDVIGSGSQIKINKFFLSGASNLGELSDFKTDQNLSDKNFPFKIFQGNTDYSYEGGQGFLTTHCEVTADIGEEFYFNGIGLVYEDENKNQFLLAVSSLPTQQHCRSILNSFEIKLPILSDASGAIINFEPGDRVTLNQMKKEINKHDKDIKSHPELSLNLNSILKALELEKLYGDAKIEYEFFYNDWTLTEMKKVNVISGVSGDDTLDVEESSFLSPGCYVVYDKSKKEVIEIKEVLNTNRLRLCSDLRNNFNETAKISKTSIEKFSLGEADLKPGDCYITNEIDLGNSEKPKSVTIRRSKTEGNPDLFIKRVSDSDFSKIEYKWKRDINEDYFDYEYEFTTSEPFIIKLEVKANEFKILHLVFIDEETGLTGEHHPPEKPINSYPVHNANGVNETPTFSAQSYVHPRGTFLKSMEIEISTSQNFDNPLLNSNSPSGITFKFPRGKLLVNTKYYWRLRFRDILGGISKWSQPTAFTTKSSFQHIETPDNNGPSSGAENIGETPTLSASVFNAVGGQDTHEKSQWRVRHSNKNWENPVYDSGETDNLISHVIPARILDEGEETYYWQVRYKGASIGWSEWSQETSFKTRDVFANIVGIALIKSGGGAGQWTRITGKGEVFTPDPGYFNNHPVYKNISDVVVDGQRMVKIPKFYFKVSRTGAAGSATEGKNSWWISDAPMEGFDLHPAFLDGAKEIDFFLVGKYEAYNQSGNKVGSKAGQAPLVNINIREMEQRCTVRNQGSVSGFHHWTIHELSAIQFLCLIEIGTPDVQGTIGNGNTSSSVAVNTGNSNASWRGIHELWGNVWHFVSGIELSSANKLLLHDAQGQLEDIGYLMAPQSGNIADVEGGFPNIFLSTNTVSNYADATYADYFYVPSAGSKRICVHGGFWGNTSNAGLFYLSLSKSESSMNSGMGGRLAKK